MYFSQGKFEFAEKYLVECVELTKTESGKAPLSYISNLNNLGNIYLNQGKLELAEKYFAKCNE